MKADENQTNPAGEPRPGYLDPMFDDLEQPLPPGSWQQLQRRKRRRLAAWWWLPAALLLLGGTWCGLSNISKPLPLVKSTHSEPDSKVESDGINKKRNDNDNSQQAENERSMEAAQAHNKSKEAVNPIALTKTADCSTISNLRELF